MDRSIVLYAARDMQLGFRKSVNRASLEASFKRRLTAGPAVCVACMGIAGFSGGCATLTLSAVGSVVGSVASPIQGILSAGKVHAAEMVDFQGAIAAARAAANDLGMHAMPGETPDPRDLSLEQLWFEDDKCNRLRVKIERRARSLAVIDIDVGFFGSDPVAHLYLDRLRKHIPGSEPTSRDRSASS